MSSAARAAIAAAATLALGAIACRAGAQRAAGAPLTVRDVATLRQFADRVQLALAPDGRLVAYTITSGEPASAAPAPRGPFTPSGVASYRTGTDVCVAGDGAAAPRCLGGAQATSWGPAWSPDGTRLAFLSDRDGQARVWLWDRRDGSLRRLAEERVRAFFGFEGIEWSPDGRRVLVKLWPSPFTTAQLERLMPGPARERAVEEGRTASLPTARVFTSDAPRAARAASTTSVDSAPSFLNVALADLATLDVETGAVHRLARGVRVMAYRFAPDGDRVAYTVRQPDDDGSGVHYDRYDLFVADSASAPRLVASRLVQEYGLSFSWSPDGRWLAFLSAQRLHVVDPARGGPPRVLGDSAHPMDWAYRAPLWSDDATVLATVRDTLWAVPLDGAMRVLAAVPGRRIPEIVAPATAQRVAWAEPRVVLLDPATKRAGFARVQGAAGRARPLLERDIALGAGDLSELPYHLSVSRDGRHVAFVAESADWPAEVWLADADLGNPVRLTALNPGVSDHRLGRARLVQWRTSLDSVLQGALLLPADYVPGRRYPLVVKVYGGSSLSGRLNRFGLERGVDNLQLLATRGYAVLLPDAPLRVGSPAADLAADILPALDSVVAMGIADSTRLGVMGHSYGGYSVLALLVQTHRFRAAVSSGGFSNLFSQYGELRDDGSAVGVGWSEHDQGRMPGSPWDDRDAYLRNSPFFWLDRVTTPVLLLHGGADPVSPPARAAETFVALRRLGKTVTFVRYEGEGHHPGSWSAANADDYWTRIFGWFATYLERRP